MAKFYAQDANGNSAVLSISLQNFTQSLAQNGWCKLPNGLILQWLSDSLYALEYETIYDVYGFIFKLPIEIDFHISAFSTLGGYLTDLNNINNYNTYQFSSTEGLSSTELMLLRAKNTIYSIDNRFVEYWRILSLGLKTSG